MRQRTNRCRCDLKHGGSNLYDTARRMHPTQWGAPAVEKRVVDLITAATA